jgi:hypothetical protein
MSDPTVLSFRYRLEQQPPHTSCGGLVRGASVRQFSVSQMLNRLRVQEFAQSRSLIALKHGGRRIRFVFVSFLICFA